MEMSPQQSLWKACLGTGRSEFCAGVTREDDRTIDIHADTFPLGCEEKIASEHSKDKCDCLAVPVPS